MLNTGIVFNFFLFPTMVHHFTFLSTGRVPIWYDWPQFLDFFELPFIKSIVSFVVQKFLMSIKFGLSVFPLVACSFGVITK